MISKGAKVHIIDTINGDMNKEYFINEILPKIEKDLDRLEKLEKVIELCLTKYVPLDSLSPSFWESKEVWLSTMSYEYYLFLCEECEYVIKENRRLTLDEFDLIYSEDLNVRKYSNIDIHCCFNIYKRPEGSLNTKPPSYKLNDIEVIEFC